MGAMSASCIRILCCTCAAALVGLVVSCSPAPLEMIVELRTDLVPGVEYAGVRSTIVGSDQSVDHQVSPGPLSLQSLRVAEFTDLVAGTKSLRVTLLDGRGYGIAERIVRIQQEQSMVVTVLITRDCRGVRCPQDQTCFGGACQGVACSEETPDECGQPECSQADQCALLAECSQAQCVMGVCAYESTSATDAACGTDLYCQPEAGCVGSPDFSQHQVDADLTGDGYGDLVVHSTTGLRLFEGGESFNPTSAAEAQSHLVAPEGCTVSGTMQRADITGDGNTDLLTLYSCDGLSTLSIVEGPVPTSTLGLDTAFRTIDLVGAVGVGGLGIGDLSGDGEPDLFARVSGVNNRDGSATGQIWVYFGLNDLLEADTPDVIIEGEMAGDNFGTNTAHRPGDLTGDGVVDLLVGAHHSSLTGSNAGAAYVFEGPLVPGTYGARELAYGIYTGRHAGSLAGVATALWDANLDGQLDMVVGADEDNSGGAYAGRVFVFYGPVPEGEHSLGEADRHITGSSPDEYGTGLDADTDLNGDHQPDLLIWSCCGRNGSLRSVGNLTGVYASTAFESLDHTNVPFNYRGEEDRIRWGVPASVGDLNGDGFDDFAASHQRGYGGDGAVYLYFGGRPRLERGGALESADLVLLGLEGQAEAFAAAIGHR